jgi:hypothetical protein
MTYVDRHATQCQGKIPFANRAAATDAIRRQQTRRVNRVGRDRRRKNLAAYHCPHCHNWHIGHPRRDVA